MEFHKTVQWRRKAKYIKHRDEGMCRECYRYGRTDEDGLCVAGNTVHHCIPVDEDWGLRFDDSNLILLCPSCHNAMHHRVTNGLTEAGEYWRRRAARVIKFKQDKDE